MSLKSPATFYILAGPGVCFVLDASHLAEPMDLLQLPETGDNDMQSFKRYLGLVSLAAMGLKAQKLLHYEHIDPCEVINYQVPHKQPLCN